MRANSSPQITEFLTRTWLTLGAIHIKLLRVWFKVGTVRSGYQISDFEMSFGLATTSDFSFKSNFVELSCFYCVC